MDTLVYVALIVLAIASNITATLLVEKFKRKGLIYSEEKKI